MPVTPLTSDQPRSDDAGRPAGSRLRRWRLPTVVVIVGVLIVGAAWWKEQSGRVDPGLVETSEKVVGGESTTVDFQVPGGRVQVGLSASTDDDGDGVRPPRGGRLVEVSWTGRATPRQDSVPSDPRKVAIPLWIRSGDERVQLTEDVDLVSAQTAVIETSDSLTRVVGFSEDRRDLVVEVGFAGRRQSVVAATGERRMGSFASLYRPIQPVNTAGSTNTTRQSRGSLRWSAEPRVWWDRQPYVDGLGWARPGKEWMVFRETSLRVTNIESTAPDGGSDRSYEADLTSTGTGNITLTGGRVVRKPQRAVVPSPFRGVQYDPGRPVFEVAKGEATTVALSVTTPVHTTDRSGEAPRREGRVVATQRVSIPAVAEPGADR